MNLESTGFHSENPKSKENPKLLAAALLLEEKISKDYSEIREQNNYLQRTLAADFHLEFKTMVSHSHPPKRLPSKE